MSRPYRILFLQLPQPDNDPSGWQENERLAAAYLRHALRGSPAGRGCVTGVLPPAADRLDNRHLLERIRAARPDLIAATLYAWNVERTIRVLRALRRECPGVAVAVGGPEVAPDHPFLFAERIADAAAVGEGEPVFPAIVEALRTGGRTDLHGVAWRSRDGYRWGSAPRPVPSLEAMLPPPDDPWLRSDRRGIAYLETTRGCPLRCAFCCYDQRRRRLAALPVERALERVGSLIRSGAREIRIIDPTFNAHPAFDALLEGLVALNRGRRAKFFAELRADTLTARQADRLAAAGFAEIEVGVQSMDPAVLRAVRRPAPVPGVLRGIGRLSRRGIGTVLDVMCGLPGQTRGDVEATLARLHRTRGAYVQLLHTLLLPGTELRRRRSQLGLESEPLPPYRVTCTPTLTPGDMEAADETAARMVGFRLDSAARRYVGWRLPDLFEERVVLRVGSRLPARVPGRSARRAVILTGTDLFARREWIADLVRRAARSEPDLLWQFVLAPASEEPLDLADAVVAALDAETAHFLDRLKVRAEGRSRVARRVFVLLRPGGRYSRGWRAAMEAHLRGLFG